MMECTGLSASWCPIHGDCICPVNEAGEHVTMDGFGFGRDNPACPLHSPSSTHGEPQFYQTAWGLVPAGGEG